MKGAGFIAVAIVSLLAVARIDAANGGHTKGRAVEPFTPILKAGDYSWHPDFSPAGPVVVFVSLPEQMLHVYRNGVLIGRSTVSSGKSGKRTPTGVFTVLQKKVHHESSIYKGAKMPHMQRLTWTGIAMHAGQLPGYPASAGCVRLPVDFAAKLYGVTGIGTTVIIADNKTAPSQSTPPALLFLQKSRGGPIAGFVWTPEKARTGPLSIVVSGKDRTVYVYRNGVEIGRALIEGIDRLSGTYVYSALEKKDSNGQWDWISTVSTAGRAPNLKQLSKRAKIAPEFLASVRALVAPGTTLILADSSVNPSTQSNRGFGILTD